MRLFIALPLPAEIRLQLERYQSNLRRAGASGNFSRSVNLHITLAFLGEQPDGKAAAAAMERVEAAPFSFALAAPGRFRQEGQELLYLAPDREEELIALAGKLRACLWQEGILLDKRPFTAHLTLGRQLRGGWEAAQRAPLPELPILAERMVLFRSDRPGGRLTYTSLYEKKF